MLSYYVGLSDNPAITHILTFLSTCQKIAISILYLERYKHLQNELHTKISVHVVVHIEIHNIRGLLHMIPKDVNILSKRNK